MKKLFLIPILFGLILIYSFASNSKVLRQKASGKILTKLPKEITTFTGEMVYVPSGTFISELIIGDSTYYPSQQVSVQAFYMSETEVTNLQYRNFYKDMVNLFGRDSAAFYIPDTTSFTKDLPYAFTKPMENHYYSHPAYDNYPVIGVSWLQASGFIKWVNLKMEKVYEEHPDWNNKYALNNFRIPTEMEWEYAAKGDAKRTFYSWGNDLMNAEKGSIVWNGNFGSIKDENGVEVKSHMADNSMFMATVDSYKPNNFGIYNMSGNVNEWVQDTYVDRNNDSYEINPLRESDISIKKLTKEDITKINFNKVIKGGSYLDSPAFCMIGNRRAMAADSSRCDVGFRICTTFYRDPESFSVK